MTMTLQRNAPNPQNQPRPYPQQYMNALMGYWARTIQPANGDSPKIGYQTTHFLSSLLVHMDIQFALDKLVNGEPLSLTAEEYERVTGYSERHCRTLRAVAERYGLITVVPGTMGGRGREAVAAKLYFHFDAMMAPVRFQARQRHSVPDKSTLARHTVPPIATLPYEPSFEFPAAEDATETAADRTNEATQITREPEKAQCQEPPTKSSSADAGKPVSIPPEDMALAAPVIGVWQKSAKCSPRRRGRPVVSEGDAAVVTRIAELRRAGMPNKLLMEAFADCIKHYSPEQDPKVRSPFIHSLRWFAPWVEQYAEPWALEAERARQRAEYDRRQAEKRDEEARKAAESAPKTLREFVASYARHTFLPPDFALLSQLDGIDPALAADFRVRGLGRQEIMAEVRSKVGRV